uniref:Uncharacterized protein n=1 Tax=Tanacetum cinerariifolium TaxID=118510 RepID=A0A699GEE8_TANCI|nr:hypothetical protein [Tanacetum cinerariifolium]
MQHTMQATQSQDKALAIGARRALRFQPQRHRLHAVPARCGAAAVAGVPGRRPARHRAPRGRPCQRQAGRRGRGHVRRLRRRARHARSGRAHQRQWRPGGAGGNGQSHPGTMDHRPSGRAGRENPAGGGSVVRLLGGGQGAGTEAGATAAAGMAVPAGAGTVAPAAPLYLGHPGYCRNRCSGGRCSRGRNRFRQRVAVLVDAAAVAAVARVDPLFARVLEHMAHLAGAVDAVVLEHDHLVERDVRQHAGVFEQHATGHVGAAADVAAVTDPGWSDDGAACFDLATGADVHGADNGGAFPVDRGVQADPQAVFHLDAGHFHVGHFAHHDALRHFPVILDAADVDPVEGTVLGVERQAFFRQQREQVGTDVEHLAARDQVQHFRFEDIDTGAGKVGQRFFLRGLFLELLDAAVLVADYHAIAGNLVPWYFAADHAGQRAAAAVFEQGRLDVEVDHGVAAQHDGGVVEEAAEFLDTLHAARRAQRFRDDVAIVIGMAFERVADLDAILMAFAEVVFDFFVQIADVDHDIAHAVFGQVLDQIGHHRLAEDRNHRLGQIIGQWTYARALASGQYHCFHLQYP